MEFLQALYKLEIAGCNEITEQVGYLGHLRNRVLRMVCLDPIYSLYGFQGYKVLPNAFAYCDVIFKIQCELN